jgi:hypothetical protein
LDPKATNVGACPGDVVLLDMSKNTTVINIPRLLILQPTQLQTLPPRILVLPKLSPRNPTFPQKPQIGINFNEKLSFPPSLFRSLLRFV